MTQIGEMNANKNIAMHSATVVELAVGIAITMVVAADLSIIPSNAYLNESMSCRALCVASATKAISCSIFALSPVLHASETDGCGHSDANATPNITKINNIDVCNRPVRHRL